ncbi:MULTISPECIES: O-antigen ligase family protein [Bacillaceae]|uniref:O-antigen ligase family protein n=1 Tax=Bacillaceae TaxID=186817 RepID=UPI002964722E|nr:O-antigen ligase family protein [Bacillus infantis]MDW2876416.1 O-antigen ligase family protein [Bacillus infantis]
MSKLDEIFGEKIKERVSNRKEEVQLSEDQLEMKKADSILVWGLLLILLVVPLIARVHFSEFASPLVTGTSLDTGMKSDIFTFYKFVVLLIGTIGLAIVFLYKVVILGYMIPKSKINLLTGILAVLIVLSAVFAPNKSLALFGMYNRHEGTLTYLCYITLFFIASNITLSSKNIKWFIYVLYPFVLINTTLGLLGFYGFDILKTDFGKNLLFSNMPEGSHINEGSKLISTINHGNYVSGVSAVIIGLLLTWSLLDKNRLRSLINLLFSLAAFSMLLASLSSSGFVTLLAVSPLIILLIIKSKNKKQFIIVGMSFVLLSGLILSLMSSHNSKVWDESIGFFVSNNPFDDNKDVGLTGQFTHHVYAAEKVEYNFPELPESGVGAGSGRLYIWGKAWDLIKERPLLGYGLDTFTYHFPQNDPGKHANIETYTVVVDKPHNAYVGIAFGCGIPALIILCILLFVVLKHLFFLVINNYKIGSVLLIFMLAWATQYLFNDSLLGINIIFWIHAGLSFSYVNRDRAARN